ncbi:hypothetical protein MKX03_030808, partial [Papaver bracteatum]
MKLPPDQERCCETGGKGINIYRCKNFRMSHGAAAADDSVPNTKFCEHHYNYYAEYKNLKKKRNGVGEGAAGPIAETTGSKRGTKKKVTEEEDDDT